MLANRIASHVVSHGRRYGISSRDSPLWHLLITSLAAPCFLPRRGSRATTLSRTARAEHTPKYAASWLERDQISWKGSVLRHMLEGVVYWSEDEAKGLEHARSMHQHAINLARKGMLERGPETPFIPLYPAGVWLLKRFTHPSCPPIQRSHIDGLAGSLNVWQRDGEERKWNTAKLYLNAGAAEPDKAFEFLRSYEERAQHSTFLKLSLSPSEHKAKKALRHFLVHTAQTLRAHGRLPDAMWTLEFGRRHVPELFSKVTISGDPEPIYLDPLHPHSADTPDAANLRRGEEVLMKMNQEERERRIFLNQERRKPKDSTWRPVISGS